MGSANKEYRWKKIGGGTLRYIRGHIIKPGEVFIATEQEIPQAFRSKVVALDEVSPSTDKKQAPTVNNPHYEIVPSGAGWFDVVNTASRKPINEKKLREADAEKVLKELL